LKDTITELQNQIKLIEQEKQAALLKMEMENDQKLAKLTNLMSGSQKKGWLFKEKHGIKNLASPWHKRYFVLKDNILGWYRDESASGKASGHIYVESYRVYKLDDKENKKPFCFELIDQKENRIKLAADNEEGLNSWMEALKNAKNRKFAQKKAVPQQEEDEELTFSDAPTSSSTTSSHPDDSKPIIKEGWLEKKGQTRRNWNKRWFVLRGSTLSYYAAQDYKVLKGRVNLVGSRVLTHAVKRGEEKPLIFAIRNPDRDFIIRASGLDEKDSWIKVIKENIVLQ